MSGPTPGYTPREDALARLFASLYQSDLAGLRWALRLIQPSVWDLLPTPIGLAPLRYGQLAVLSLDRETTAAMGPLWALLLKERPGRARDIETVRALWA